MTAPSSGTPAHEHLDALAEQASPDAIQAHIDTHRAERLRLDQHIAQLGRLLARRTAEIGASHGTPAHSAQERP